MCDGVLKRQAAAAEMASATDIASLERSVKKAESLGGLQEEIATAKSKLSGMQKAKRNLEAAHDIEPSQRPEMQQVTTALKEILDSLLVQLFHDTDLDHDGLVSLSELTTKLSSPEYAFDEAQIQRKFAQYDKTGSGQLNQGQAINLFKNLYVN